MVEDLVRQQLDDIPEPPSSLYLRPTLIGTLPNIGAAAAPSTEAVLFVLASPVGDYFAGGARPLKLLVADTFARSTEQLGSTKTGGNYAASLVAEIDRQGLKKAVLVGAGFIGLEVAEALINRGLDVTMVDTALRPGGVFALGLHLTDYAQDRRQRERWVGRRGGTQVVCNLQSWPPDRRRRRERLRSRLTKAS